MSRDYDLKDKVAIVTGGAKGIGKAIAFGLADCGAAVVVASRTKDELEAVAHEIKGKGGKAFAVVTDLMATEQIDNLVEMTIKTHKRIDILVNNAARSFLRPLMELREDGWDKIFNTNCKGAFLLSRAVARVMMDQSGGRIVNITTVGAVRGGAGMGVYHASKAALSMLTKCMAVEWAPYNINVNAVGPGLTKTAFSQPIWANPEVERGIASRIPKGRLAEPEEIVGAVLFLCSDDSSFITGQSIYVDGGTLANA
ncbi:MAG: SDR family oxidoreductase [Deltaproteobacteria bacterium]|nr:SDR family oxidoreductase [Deltaproteobacteria bacterium]MBW2084794.1 SDR family oxidoreductase [Deltaproteobacteria bacterium]